MRRRRSLTLQGSRSPSALAFWSCSSGRSSAVSFFFNDTATTEIYTLSLHDALPISRACHCHCRRYDYVRHHRSQRGRSEEHTSELQSRGHLVCRLLLEKKKNRA